MMDSSNVTTLVEGEKGLFYRNAAQYWSQVPPTVDGMLGGFGFISHIDIQGSCQFLRSLFKLQTPPGKTCALDCGAGIGRITKNLLLNVFDKVDLVEQNSDFVRQAQASFGTHQNMGSFFCSGLQDFKPKSNSYDIIWCQWVLGHLTDDDLIMFLQACKHGLKANGLIVLKENITSGEQLEVDEVDSSVTRPLPHLCRVLKKAGLRRIKQRRQEKFPSSLYPVYMIAACPVYDESSPEKQNLSEEVVSSHHPEANVKETCCPAETSANLVQGSNVRSGAVYEREQKASIVKMGTDHSCILNVSPILGVPLDEEPDHENSCLKTHESSSPTKSPPQGDTSADLSQPSSPILFVAPTENGSTD